MPFGWDLLPGVNVGNAVNQLFDHSKDYDVFDDYTVSGRQGQTGPNIKTASQNRTSSQQTQPARNDGSDTPIGDVYSGGAGGVGGRSLADIAADRAYLDDQEARLRRQLGSTESALNNGLTSLNDSFNAEVSKSNQERSRALENFELQRGDTNRAKDSALNRNDTNARTLADSLRRRIGLAGGSSSSAFQLAAPNAVSKVANDGRSEVMENFGQNFRDLGLAEDRAKQDYEEYQKELEAQKRSRESDFRAGILNNQNQITNSLSEVARQRALLGGGGYAQVKEAISPFAAQIDQRQSTIDNLFNQFRTPYNVKPVEVKAPSLRDYVVDRQTIGQNTQPGAVSDPYAEALRKRRQEEQPL